MNLGDGAIAGVIGALVSVYVAGKSLWPSRRSKQDKLQSRELQRHVSKELFLRATDAPSPPQSSGLNPQPSLGHPPRSPTLPRDDRIAALQRAGLPVEMEYTDGQGVVTRRVVSFVRGDPLGDAKYLIGYCFLRGEDRTFRADRILELVDLRTELTVSDLAQFFAPLFPPRPEKRDLNLAGPGLLLLIWICQAAEEPEADESALIEYLTDRLRLGSVDGQQRAAWSAWFREQHPTFEIAAAALVRAGQRERALIEQFSSRIIVGRPRRAARAKKLKLS